MINLRNRDNIRFNGLIKTNHCISKSDLEKLMNLAGTINSGLRQDINSNLSAGIGTLNPELNVKTLEELVTSDLKGDLKIIFDKQDSQIIKFTKNLLLPVDWVLKLGKNTANAVKSATTPIDNKLKDCISEIGKLGGKGRNDFDPIKTFNIYFKYYLESKKISVTESSPEYNKFKYKAAKRFLKENDALKESQINKNLVAQIKFIQAERTHLRRKFPDISEETLNGLVESSYNSKVKKPLSSSNIKYNAAVRDIWNRFLASAVTAIFLIFDAYNLNILHNKKDDKELATQKAQQRGIQELSRTLFASYNSAIFNKTLEKFYNKSLLGSAWVVTLTVLSLETLARKSVGNAITPQRSQQDLLEIEKRNQKSKNPFLRWVAGIIGKKPISSVKVNHFPEFSNNKIRNQKDSKTQNTLKFGA